ncbi:MAG: efflux RND transporter permease subunit [Planctomycetota bacterium]|jgi:multidrug efflux pump subunit AcrB
MKGPIAWFAKNPVAANLLMVLIIAGGIFAASSMRLEMYPELSVDIVTVTVAYPGATPEEVEESICVKIEEKVQDLEGIKRLRSTAAENVGTVAIEVATGYEVREIMDDVKSRVDAIDSFPELAEKPVIQEIVTRNLVANLSVWGDVDERVLRQQGEDIREALLDIPGITQVELAGVRPYEIAIEVSEASLRKHGLTLHQVAGAVRRSSLNLPGGSLKTEGGEILLRTQGQAYTGEAFSDLTLLTREDGTRVRLGDVATVVDRFEETDRTLQFNGKPAVAVRVFKVGDQNVIDIARKVRAFVAASQARMPEGIHLTVWRDFARFLEGRLDLLTRNGFAGLVLVFIVLALFLRMRLAFWVALGIPICFLGAMWVMPQLDVSMNMISMFAFILVLGVVVDDAIVVGESIHTEQSKGGNRRMAAILGTKKVAIPVVFAVFTTVAAFLPMAFLPGMMGKYIFVIPVVFIATVLFSLVESMLILPAHLSHGGEKKDSKPGLLTRIQDFFAQALLEVARVVYRPLVEIALRFRYATVAFFIAAFLLTLGIVASGRLDFTFFPKMEADFVIAKVLLPEGVAVQDTERVVKKMEKAILEIREALTEESGGEDTSQGIIRHVLASVGTMPVSTDAANGVPQARGSHVGEVAIELSPAEGRTMGSTEVTRLWRERIGSIPEAEELTFVNQFGSIGKPIDIQLSGKDLNALRKAADDLKGKLAVYPGVYGITDSFRLGKKEVKLKIKPEAEPLGLSLADLASQVRRGFYGEEAQRIQRGSHDVAVKVRYPKRERATLGSLENMRVRTPAGVEVPFSAVADAEFGRSWSAIQRTDRRRTIHVTAQVDDGVSNAEKVLANLESEVMGGFLAENPGVKYSFEGEKKEANDSMAALFRGFILSLLMIYALLAVPFKSYLQPFVVMGAIPFGLVGAILGHVIMGIDLSVMSVLGMIALAGITVNDSLVLIDFINRGRREKKMPLVEAVRKAGVARFRPIILTSLTTGAGLLPMLLETSIQAKFLIPTAVSLAFGVLFSTLITLLLVPSGYLILEDLRGAVAWVIGAGKEALEVEPSGENTAGETVALG